MLGVLGVNTIPPPMDLSASGAEQHAASVFYLVVAVALPSMLFVLIGLRIISAPARWAGWGQFDYGSWAWRVPYETFVIAFPVAATAVGEWLAIVALESGSNRSIGANRLILGAGVGIVAMGISAVRFLSRVRPHAGAAASLGSDRTESAPQRVTV